MRSPHNLPAHVERDEVMVSGMRFPVLLSIVVLAASLGACKTSERNPTTSTTPGHGNSYGHSPRSEHADPFVGREVVTNYEAKPGDVTICPYSGKKFEVAADSPRMEWQGKSWVFCCNMCLDDVRADPDKYLGKYLEDE